MLFNNFFLFNISCLQQITRANKCQQGTYTALFIYCWQYVPAQVEERGIKDLCIQTVLY